MTYTDVYEYNLKLYDFVTSEYENSEQAWCYYKESYIDPDGYPFNGDDKKDGIIKCSSDALLSIRRIKEYEGFGSESDFRKIYEVSRKKPLLYFPKEAGGINQSRALLLEDRIDHTLYDLKRHCARQECILRDSYEKEKTKKWLESFDCDFHNIIDWMGVRGILTDENYNVYDLQCSSKTEFMNDKKMKLKYLHPRNKKYMASWGKEYYKNVKALFDK